MYFPYLVARGEETAAIIATVCTYPDNNVVPVLEPYADDDDELFCYNKLVKLVENLIGAEKTFVLKINCISDLDFLKSKFSNLDDYCVHGYESSNPNYINDQQNIAIIHKNQEKFIPDKMNIKYNIFMPSVVRFESYLGRYNCQKTVLIEDGFVKHEPNSDYPPSEDFNSELCFTFRSKKILGFGDFTILEEGFRPAGGGKQSSITHVIHLTKAVTDPTSKIVVYHFLTTPSEETDITRRSTKTIKKAFDASEQFYETVGIRSIQNKYPNGTSLGMYKRIGITHHIDLIHSLL